MKTLTNLAILLLLIGCASETEQKSLDDIAAIYKAKTSYSKGFNSSAGQETVRQFNVKVSESKLIDSLPPEVTSSNIALIVYEGLTEKERKNYNLIDVELVNLEQDTASYQFTPRILEKLSKKAVPFKNFSENLVAGDFEKASANMSEEILSDPRYLPGTQGKIKSDSERFGKLISYTAYGITEIANADYVMLQYHGFLNYYSGKSIPYFVNVNSADGDDSILGFNLAN